MRASGRTGQGVAGRLLAWSFLRVPLVAALWSGTRRGFGDPSFAPLTRPLPQAILGLVTTGGVHHRDQPLFKGKEESPPGDGTWRRLDLTRPRESFTLTHDWYDHRDAERDLNLVLPADRLREFASEGIIGALHATAVGLMGHVEGKEELRLELETAPAVAGLFRQEGVDAVLLVPA